MRYHPRSVRMAVTKKKTENAGEDMETREALRTVGGNISWCSHYGKQDGGSSNK